MKSTVILGLVALVGVGAVPLLVDSTPGESAPVAATNTLASTNELPESVPAVVPVATAVPANLTPGVEEIVQLARARVGDEVLLAYIENSTNAYPLKVEEILYLHDVGVTAEVVAAMVRHTPAGSPPPAAGPAGAEVAAAAPAPPAVEAAPTETEPPPPTQVVTNVTNNYFYNSLSSYGNWVDVPDYGWCWQPTVAVVNTEWQPYCDNGRWVYTDAGWYWNSYYSWGWAPFHYGRWHRHASWGWVWAPDNVWGPAWVTWRYYDGYCGWAPLPPHCYYQSGIGLTYYGSSVSFSFGFGLGYSCYTFVPVSQFHCDRPWAYRVPHSEGLHAYKHSTPINHYTHGSKHGVVNVGPGTSRFAAASRSEIRRVALRDTGAPAGPRIQSERLSRDGTTLSVYRPKLPNPAARPPAEITQRQEENRHYSEALTKSPTVRTATQQSHTIAPRSPATGSSSGIGQPMANPQTYRAPANRTTSGRTGVSTESTAPRTPSRNENPRNAVTPAPAPNRTTPPTESPAPTTQREEATRPRSTVMPRSNPSPTPAPVIQPSRPVTPRPAPSRVEPVRPAPQPYTAPQQRMSAPAIQPQSAPRTEVRPQRAPAPQPSYQPAPSYSAPAQPTIQSRPAPTMSAPSYSPAPRPSMAPSRAPAMSSPSAAPARSAPAAPSGPSRGASR